MVTEAVKRMKALKMLDTPIKEFIKEGKLNKSEMGMGILYWIDDEEKALVEAFEKEHECLVYHIIKSVMSFGVVYTYLYVSKYEEEWVMDMADLLADDAYKNVCAYCWNESDPELSEFGYVGIIPCNGGVKRVA